MSVQFILGNSGSGKSHYVYSRVIEESGRHPEGNFIVIVPEQFTMQTQRDLVRLHPSRGIMNIDVLSFRRLAHRVFEEVGADRRSVLTETGKNLMIRKVAIQERERLTVLGSRMNRPGYVSEVKSILSELMQYEITDFEMGEMLRFSEKRPLLHAKLSDLRVLYRAFLEYQRELFLKPEELLDVLCQVAGQSELLRNSTLALDGFAGFTPSQMKVLEELMKICPRIWITVTLDAGVSPYGEIHEHELFAVSRRLVQGVSAAAMRAYREGSGMIEPPVVLGKEGCPRFRREGALAHLERNLFREKRRTYRGEPEEISLHVSPNPASEVHFAARTISRLVRERGLRYREIAVITGNMSSYDNYVRKIFPLYEIPAFLDETRHILLNPCLEFIRGALEMAERDFSCESVFRCLRAGMTDFAPEEIDRLENYVLAAGIDRRWKWEQEWTYRTKNGSEEELEFCNGCRERVLERFGLFASRMGQKGRTLREYGEALYELLADCQVQQRLKDREQELSEAGDREEASEYGQIYGILMKLLDEMVDLLGEEPMDGKEFGEILDAGFSEARVGVIPPGIDQVQVGDLERSRLAHVRVLFFLGLNDGWVPSRGDGGGIVTDMERELLKGAGIELAPSARENSYIQRFYLYQNLTKPKEHLYLSWCLGSSDGAVARPSYLVSTVRRMFPDMPVTEEGEAGSSLYQVTSKKNGMLYLARGLQERKSGARNREWEALYCVYRRDPDYREKAERLARAAFSRGTPSRLSYHTSRELYGEVMTNSVTRLEQFAACAFAHFALYGLRLEERELYGVKPADLGIIFHRSLELFSRQISREGREWMDLTEQEQQVIMERCVEEVTEEYGAKVFHSSARSEYAVRRLKRILCRSAWALHEQLASGSFRPTGFEVSFEDAGDLEAVNVRFGEKGRIRLLGRIDRIDTAETEDAVYVKIVDYKSGMTQFDPVSLYYGLQLQLVVYLNAALEMERRLHRGKEVVPAGIFYYRMQDPVLDLEPGLEEQEARDRLLKKLRPDGILNSDQEILRMLDHHLDGDSLVIPVGLRKDGRPKAASSVVTTEQFALLSDFVAEKLRTMGERMLEGEIGVSPYGDKNGSACDFCLYGEVCGFDRKIPGMCLRQLPALSKEEVWARIAAETAGAKEKSEGVSARTEPGAKGAGVQMEPPARAEPGMRKAAAEPPAQAEPGVRKAAAEPPARAKAGMKKAEAGAESSPQTAPGRRKAGAEPETLAQKTAEQKDEEAEAFGEAGELIWR